MQAISKAGDFFAAEKRISDFETAWDESQDKLRPLNGEAWGHIDAAADTALHALRAKNPDPSKVAGILVGLAGVLDNPYGSESPSHGETLVSGIAVADATGHPLPCEAMLKALRSAIDTGKIKVAVLNAAKEFESKATERCNADDDVHADEFSARGLAFAAG